MTAVQSAASRHTPPSGSVVSTNPSTRRARTLLIAHPSADVYGADLQMLQTVSAMHARGWRVVVVTPDDGPLVPRLTRLGAEVEFLQFPVLRRANASARGVASLTVSAAAASHRMRRRLKQIAPDVVYVSTVTIPWWLAVARTLRIPAVCHVHEAEDQDRRIIRVALNAPLLAANSLIAISPSTVEATTQCVPLLRQRTQLIYNGVPTPETTPQGSSITEPTRLMVAGRLSPRKAPHIALEATAILRRSGRDVRLEVCGTAFDGYERYEQELRDRAAQPDLAGAVTFSGYVSPMWPALDRSHIVLAPSLREPFGNIVVEAQLARRPVVAAAAMGHLDTVIHHETGLLVEPGNAEGMADAVARLIDDAALAGQLTTQAAARAKEKFSVARYADDVARLITATARTPVTQEHGR